MTKSSKIITGLGLVAALGIAIVPASSFATDPYVNGQVEVDVEVLPAIAMTITGNNDNNAANITSGAYTAGTYQAVDNYDHDGGETETETGSVMNHASAHITGVSSSYASLLPNNKVDGAFGDGANGFGSTITVYTNDSDGYTLTLKDADTTTALTNEDGETIAAGTTITAGTSNWAYKIMVQDGTDVASPVYAAIAASTATAAQITQTDDATTTAGSVSKVAYGVSTKSDQKTGIYADTIVYTASVR